jgi:hypothetical protein
MEGHSDFLIDPARETVFLGIDIVLVKSLNRKFWGR